MHTSWTTTHVETDGLDVQGLVRGASFMEVGSPVGKKPFYLQCRRSEHVTPQAFLGESEEFGLCKLHFRSSKMEPAWGKPSWNSILQSRGGMRTLRMKATSPICSYSCIILFSTDCHEQCRWAISPRMRRPPTLCNDRLLQHERDRM